MGWTGSVFNREFGKIAANWDKAKLHRKGKQRTTAWPVFWKEWHEFQTKQQPSWRASLSRKASVMIENWENGLQYSCAFFGKIILTSFQQFLWEGKNWSIIKSTMKLGEMGVANSNANKAEVAEKDKCCTSGLNSSRWTCGRCRDGISRHGK